MVEDTRNLQLGFFNNGCRIKQDQELIDQAEDTMTILSKYIDGLQLNVEPDKLKTVMRELYVEALNVEKTE